MNSLKLDSSLTKLIKRSRSTIEETVSPKSFSSSAFAEISDEPFSCRSRPTSIIFGFAPIDLIFTIDSLAAVPAEITSSTIKTFPEGSCPIIFPPSPCSFSSFLLKDIGISSLDLPKLEPIIDAKKIPLYAGP